MKNLERIKEKEKCIAWIATDDFPKCSVSFKGKRKNKYAAVNFANMILLKFFDFYDSQRKKETQTVKPSKTGI